MMVVKYMQKWAAFYMERMLDIVVDSLLGLEEFRNDKDFTSLFACNQRAVHSASNSSDGKTDQ
jgi:hypothetical protein